MLFFRKRICDLFCQGETDSWQAGDLFRWELFDSLDRSEMLEKGAFAGGADTRDVIEEAFSDAFFEQKTMVSIRRAVSLISNALQ
jgi:hypothetical protein